MIDRNFRMVDFIDPKSKKKMAVTVLRARFDGKSLDDGKYCGNNNLDNTTFSKLMNRRVTGAKAKGADTTVGKIIQQLKKDGIWWGALPWEVKNDSKKAG